MSPVKWHIRKKCYVFDLLNCISHSLSIHAIIAAKKAGKSAGRQADEHTQILMPFPGSVGIVGFVFIPFKRCIACVIVAVGFVRFFMCMWVFFFGVCIASVMPDVHACLRVCVCVSTYAVHSSDFGYKKPRFSFGFSMHALDVWTLLAV